MVEAGTKRGHIYKGLFLTFDGPDGCGKSTQSRNVVECLTREGYEVVSTREPGGTKVGDKIRCLLLDPENGMGYYTELFLFQASRAQHANEVIRPALEKGMIVCSDRFYDATTAYQGVAGNVPIDVILDTNRIASQGINPDMTCLFDAPINLLRERLGFRPEKADRIESKLDEYHQKVREGFLEIAKSEPERVRVYDASQTVDEISARVVKDVQKYIRDYKLQDVLARK